MSGKYYHFYDRRGEKFGSLDELLFGMERFFERINFPHASTNRREFAKSTIIRTDRKAERRKVMKEDELLAKHGDLGTFIVRVQHRQNSSWQGAVTWVESEQTVHFRSIWEMIKLVESAMDSTGAREHDRDRAPAWAVKENPT